MGRLIIYSEKESPFKCFALRYFNRTKYKGRSVKSGLMVSRQRSYQAILVLVSEAKTAIDSIKLS